MRHEYSNETNEAAEETFHEYDTDTRMTCKERFIRKNLVKVGRKVDNHVEKEGEAGRILISLTEMLFFSGVSNDTNKDGKNNR